MRPAGMMRFAMLGASLALGSSSAAAEDAIGGDMVVTRGMKPWDGCGECHDLDGVAGNGHFPNLAAQKASYLRKQMDDFRAARRSNDHGQMGTSSREATGRILDEVVAYFADLPPPPPVAAEGLSAAAAERAKQLLEHGSRADKIPPCVNCHGLSPKRAFDAPWLEAQQADYIVRELKDFRSGRRGNDPDGVMEKVARTLSDDDIAALGPYLMSLPRPMPSTARAALGSIAR